jgi:uncharacterized protein YegL
MAGNDIRYEGETPSNYEQKCPLVLVLDVSYSMNGTAIDELNTGLKAFQEDIKKDTVASSRLDVAIVTFGSNIDIIQDFALIDEFDMPHLTTNGTTRMVDGIDKGIEILNARKNWYKNTGQTYYRPYIVLMTDGYPDSGQDIDDLSMEIDSLTEEKHLNFWAFGVEGADMDLLKNIGHQTSLIQKLKGMEFVKFFQWLSSSMETVSNSKEGEIIDVSPKNEEQNPFQLKV